MSKESQVECGRERTIAEVRIARSEPGSAPDHHPCDHFGSENEILTDLSFHPDTL